MRKNFKATLAALVVLAILVTTVTAALAGSGNEWGVYARLVSTEVKNGKFYINLMLRNEGGSKGMKDFNFTAKLENSAGDVVATWDNPWSLERDIATNCNWNCNANKIAHNKNYTFKLTGRPEGAKGSFTWKFNVVKKNANG